MFRKVLIANRGEIAVRIIRACRELGVRCVAVYSTADRNSLHAQIADEAVCIGPPATKDSYLNMNAIIQAALNTGAEAIHPGFGFLSENSDFARLCEDNGIVFIGPSYNSIDMLGNKAAAKETMAAAGVPVIPGTKGAVKSLKEAKEFADKAGYPVLVKASAGGGGRGIRRVDAPEELEPQIIAAQQEAKNFFGDDSVYIEKFLINPHHVEIQIMADKHGNYIYLGERDCSMQRRNQKVLEECPSPIVDEALRKRMGQAAITAAKECGYYNAGTIEFLVDDNRDFYFMEMNTRIQVEHPITEEVTGFDLVKAQIEVAAGMSLSVTQNDIKLRGHAIECRINAENPELDFRPSPGTITDLYMPGGPGIRIDGAVFQGYTITPYYDSMISKLIAHGSDRQDAINKMAWALSEFLVRGVDTNIDFQLSLIRNPDFKEGNYDIGFLGRYMEEYKKK
ncbi:MAG: acetyl-CoA carboxylase biotin carboxylase subunit [Ruminococcus sp.]|nr:acetyl-CoA carboxylase biotin carboxylase subunit [Ruminococcus sp.]MBQ3948588.1 acetyl-CoA carboxylase biotin carboxylase subunit [Ruminococcus sp.]MBR6394987.1 acetyl-CoA carboxylase biotin carboxylase subunit [Ruminococcus sp.]MCR5729699.1 acetyl-CoA carboxylase biotin carboxylase subunit [Ruminococcus sp.]